MTGVCRLGLYGTASPLQDDDSEFIAPKINQVPVLQARRMLATVLFFSMAALGGAASLPCLRHEEFRPKFHFIPNDGWMNVICFSFADDVCLTC
jgi:hypothetical protein